MKQDAEYLPEKKNVKGKKAGWLIVVVLLVGLLWYFLYFQNMQQQITALKKDVAEAQEGLAIEKQKEAAKRAMLEIVNDDSIQTYIPSYGNETMLAEFKFLNTTVAEANHYNITFSDPITRNRVSVRREMNISFDNDNYQDAKDILNRVEDGEIRSLIKDIKINTMDSDRSGSAGFADNVPVTTSATLVFFETTVGAKDLDGLIVDVAQTMEEEAEGSIYE